MVNIKLKQFEGPLDLLLDLIQTEKLDITEVSLAAVTDQYLSVVQSISSEKMTSAIDFLLVASELLLLKSRLLLPRMEQDGGEVEVFELTTRLMVLQRYKQAAIIVRSMFFGHQHHVREYLPEVVAFRPDARVSVDRLHTAFAAVVSRTARQDVLEERKMSDSVVSLDEKMSILQRRLGQFNRIAFSSLFESKAHRLDIIVSFLALLELAKQNMILVEQKEPFADIELVALPSSS
jgi:segregation and condensation protein A